MVTRRRTVTWLPPLAVGLASLGLGVWRLMPGVGFWDTAEFQTVPPILGTAHPTGYPTYILLGWLASLALSPVGEAALRMNLLSAICVAVAAAVTVDLVARLTRSTLLGVVAGLGLAVTPVVWSIATHADPHALHLAFVAIILWLLVRWEAARSELTAAAEAAAAVPHWPGEPAAAESGAAEGARGRADRWLVAAAAVTGLSMGNHSLTLLLGVPILAFVVAVDRGILRNWRLVAACVAAALLTTVLVYLELPLRSGPFRAPLVYAEPNTWEGFWYVALGEQFRGGISDPFGNLPQKWVDLVDLAVRQLGAMAPLVAIAFVVTAIRRPAYALLSGLALAITVFFNAAYINADIERYYLGPALIAWTWLAILAGSVVDAISGLSMEAAGSGLGSPDGSFAGRARSRPDPYRAIALGLAAIMLLVPSVGAFEQRAESVDRSHDRAAEVWLDEVLRELEPGAIVVSWWSYSTPLWYAQHIEGRRLDVVVADDRTRLDLEMGEPSDVIDDNLDRSPVYVIRVDPSEIARLRERYELTSIGSVVAANVFRVVGPAAPDGPAPGSPSPGPLPTPVP